MLLMPITFFLMGTSLFASPVPQTGVASRCICISPTDGNSAAKTSADKNNNLPGRVKIAHGTSIYSLDNDARLNVGVTYMRHATTIAETLRVLSAQTQVKLIVTDVELGMSDLACAYHETRLRDVLDSLARIRNFAWTRRKDGALLLKNGYNSARFDIYSPHTEAEAEQRRQGLQFLKQFGKLPSGMQNAFQEAHANGLAFGTLTPEMQKTVRAMLQARVQDLADQGQTSHLDPAHMENTLVKLGEVSHQSEVDFYNISITDQGKDDFNADGKLTGHTFGESQQMQFPVFEDPRDNVERIVPKDQIGGNSWRGDQEDARSKQEGTAADARLSRHVTLAKHRYSLYEALTLLSAQAHFDFALQPFDDKTPPRPFFACTDMPLADALDALCQAHGFTAYNVPWKWTWGQRESSVLLFHVSAPPTEK